MLDGTKHLSLEEMRFETSSTTCLSGSKIVGSGRDLPNQVRDEHSPRDHAGEMLRTSFDHLNQVRRDLWRYTEVAPNGKVHAQDTRKMAPRWTYRWELYHLLRLRGFAIEAEYSDFGRSAPAYGKELILVARVA